MPSNSEFVSRVLNGARSLTKDDRIPRRYVLSVGRSKVRTYLTQRLQDRTIFREGNLVKHIPCVEMELVEVRECPIIEFRLCDILMKSVSPLPEPLFSRYGASVLSVTSLDKSVSFDYSDVLSVSTDRNRKFAKYAKKFYVQDGYLYIPNVEVYSVDVDIITLDSGGVDECKSCKNKGKKKKCRGAWGNEFICPDKLYEPVIQETLQEVLSAYKQIVPDENPNLDNTQKSQVRD